ncbi:helix-turn-helix transcriptional regulator [Catenuloplanes japonicus]|uniref:helix-turn-helix transcriptional regulator n=1 Tax=Catenuloplanes japonicus TaxID=33876 RepID=UPI001E29B424|nr:helix-turn-helix transcriptional regulator [Catenuloplanes japonicus]
MSAPGPVPAWDLDRGAAVPPQDRPPQDGTAQDRPPQDRAAQDRAAQDRPARSSAGDTPVPRVQAAPGLDPAPIPTLGVTLRSWRDRLSPAAAGLPRGLARRAPGLRREELAQLAGVSIDYVVRLEQGRFTTPSAQVVGALARALQLTDAERDHLHRLAGLVPPSRAEVSDRVPAGLARMADRLGGAAVAIFAADWQLIRWNRTWAELLGDPAAAPPELRNFAREVFPIGDPLTGPIPADALPADAGPGDTPPACAGPGDTPPACAGPGDTPPAEATRARTVPDAAAAAGTAGPWLSRRRVTSLSGGSVEAAIVSDLRRATGRFPRSRRLAVLVRALSEGNARFAALWAEGAVGAHREEHKIIDHPDGPITVDCDVVTDGDAELKIVILTAAPGSDDEARLRRLTESARW